jgi:hypothetical protein
LTCPELLRLGRTPDARQGELFAAVHPDRHGGVSNGPTEAVNALVKKIGHGFGNLDSYRLRLLVGTGVAWRTMTRQASPAISIRGRAPRLVA